MDVESLSAKPRLRLLLDHFAKIKDTRQAWPRYYQNTGLSTLQYAVPDALAIANAFKGGG
jgi:hypothetical protein